MFNKNTEDSLKKRYFYKLSTNFVGLVISSITQAIIPRGLGPKSYGDFNFLTNFFNQFVNFFDMGASTGFYTKLSQRQRESGLVSFYLYFSGIVSLMVIGLVIITQWGSIYIKIWPNQNIFYIYLAAILAILTWITQIFSSMADAYAITVYAEKAKILQKIIGLILISLLFVSHQLNLANFFYYNYIIWFFLCVVFIWIMELKGSSILKNLNLPFKKIKEYIREFYHYSHPLFIYAIVGLIEGIFDRWLLQLYGGSIQQGFFSLSNQIGVFCFLFTSALTPLIMREFSVVYAKKDYVAMAYIFRRFIPLFYSISAYLSCFIALQADKVIYISVGSTYKGALMAVTIMAFFPIHQTYGQLSGSVFYATGQTKLYRNIGITFMLIGLPLTYFLIAPKQNMGLGAGAVGMAVKMVLLNFVAVNVQLYFNSKFLKFSFRKYLGHQLVSVGCLLALAMISKFFVDKVLGMGTQIILSFILGGIFYTLMAAIFVYCAPVIFGINKQDIQFILKYIKERFLRLSER